ncbi:MAG: YqgE/AlgH family protein [Bacteroidota bacterium]
MTPKIPDIAFTNKLSPQKGRILLSDPFIGDEYFERAVVYICEHSKDGSFGFVLNNYIDVNLHQLNENFPYFDIKMSVGGPVEKETMYFMHTFGADIDDSLEISHGIYIGGDFKQLYNYLKKEHLEDLKIRFFLGYSGWTAGQLKSEIKDNVWIVANIDTQAEVMDTDEPNMWKYFMNKLGPKYKLMSDFPIDPSEN